MQTVRSGANFSESAQDSKVCSGYFYFIIGIIGLHRAAKLMTTACGQTLQWPVFGSNNDSADERVVTLAQGLTDHFVEHGWAAQEDFLPVTGWRALAVEAEQLWMQGAFHKAGIGRDPARRLQARVRGDYTLWLDRQRTPTACQFVEQELEALRLALNARACLGLFEFEGQLARYPTGASYARHLDQLRDTQARQVSVVLYLNADWQSTEGGELCLYRGPSSAHVRIPILPRGGTLVLFASADTPHEVRPATRARLSLSGWLRRRA